MRKENKGTKVKVDVAFCQGMGFVGQDMTRTRWPGDVRGDLVSSSSNQLCFSTSWASFARGLVLIWIVVTVPNRVLYFTLNPFQSFLHKALSYLSQIHIHLYLISADTHSVTAPNIWEKKSDSRDCMTGFSLPFSVFGFTTHYFLHFVCSSLKKYPCFLKNSLV